VTADDGNVQVAEVPTTSPSQRDEGPLLFISHRHADSRIADVIREFVVSQSGARVEVFQSSSAEARSPMTGKNLNQELVRSLWQANMVILVYTTEDEDWAYCMWECGVALQPETPRTRIIVFQAGDRPPSVFAGEVRVNLRDATTIEKFTNEFLTSEDFFPRYGRRITRFKPNDRNVKAAAKLFDKQLQQVLPDTAPPGVKELVPYPFMRLELSPDQVEAIRNDPTLDAAREVVQDARVAYADREARRLFGRLDMPTRATLRSLADAWKGRYSDQEANWLDGLAAQMADAARGLFPTLRWELMRAMDAADGTWYAPVVNRVLINDAIHSTQFDVYFNKFALDSETGCVRVGLPKSTRPASA
jgi:hypothetical protein